MEYIILEVGSTNTKVYYCKNNNILESKLYTIEFKKNYKLNKHILDFDVDSLCNIINSINISKDNIFVYGTSIFRDLNNDEFKIFLSEFKIKCGCNFNVVTSVEENELTVRGVISNIDYDGELAVMIGGGASTEIAFVKNKKIEFMCNQKFGVTDIMEKYPDLALDKPTTDFNEVLSYTNSLLSNINFKTDILVLAGGDYLKFYEKLKYKMQKNNIYTDDKQPFFLYKKDMDKIDLEFYYNISLDEIRNSDIENKNWWNGTRGMRFCAKAIADKIDTKYIIPTRISMVYGLIDRVINNKINV
jgi:hypothetical protein